MVRLKRGDVFNSWTFIEEILPRGSHSKCVCQCKCGKIKTIQKNSLTSGGTKSCGCSQKGLRTTHGETGTLLYRAWAGMKVRCYNKNNNRYASYGGRGISVAPEWLNDYVAFRDWAIKSGYSEGLTLERKNVNKNYEPDNCTWIPFNRQQSNRTNSVYVTYNRRRVRLSELCYDKDLDYHTVYNRIFNLKWTVADAITKPSKKEKKEK